MNNAEKSRQAHNMNTFGMSRMELDALVEQNKDRIPMFVSGILSDVQELLESAPDTQTFRKMIHQRMNVAKFAMFELQYK